MATKVRFCTTVLYDKTVFQLYAFCSSVQLDGWRLAAKEGSHSTVTAFPIMDTGFAHKAF